MAKYLASTASPMNPDAPPQIGTSYTASPDAQTSRHPEDAIVSMGSLGEMKTTGNLDNFHIPGITGLIDILHVRSCSKWLAPVAGNI